MPVFGQAPVLGGCLEGVSDLQLTAPQPGQQSGVYSKKRRRSPWEQNGQLQSETWTARERSFTFNPDKTTGIETPSLAGR